MFKKILIANRGEIACRVIKTARRMGIKTVAVYSAADSNSRHVRLADEAVLIGPAPVNESYLVIEGIINAARKTGAEAIHPGYGFLSENEAFCHACDEAGIKFIGPPVEAIRAMGSKSEAKKLMGAAGVPLTPGYHGDDQSSALLQQEADKIGYPVLIKAAAGGGGKGMRLVERGEDFAAALASCKREAASSFGSDHVLVEKYITRPRHIEIQVFADGHGNCVHLFERDCSVQRRHQKVLEEAPAPGMTPERRKEMGEAAVAAAKAVGYVGAGTVEFIANQDGSFYFMEMNTRLQVEHPVTEMITGQDLVEWQLRVASGETLPVSQAELQIRGHALETRIYAEDPAKGFLPSTGKLLHLVPPGEGRHVRVDTGVEQDDEISPFYDPMIAKLIVWDENREQALSRMAQALADYQIVGVANNIDFLSRLVRSPAFSEADLDTGLIERQQDFLFPAETALPDTVFFVAALTELLMEARQAEAEVSSSPEPASPWCLRDSWRLNAAPRRTLHFQYHETETAVEAVFEAGGDRFRLSIGTDTVVADGERTGNNRFRINLDGLCREVSVVSTGQMRHIFFAGCSWQLTRVDPLHFSGEEAGAHGGLQAPMPGKVIALLVEANSHVTKGTPLIILEAMKMEHTITAPGDGFVRSHLFAVGDQVVDGAELVDFELAVT